MHGLIVLSAHLEETFPDVPSGIRPYLIPEAKGGSALDAKHETIGDNTRFVFHQV
jgi:hypothetical protein